MPIPIQLSEEHPAPFKEISPINEPKSASPPMLFGSVQGETTGEKIKTDPETIRFSIRKYLDGEQKGFAGSAPSGDVYLGLLPLTPTEFTPVVPPKARIIFSGLKEEEVIAAANSIAAELAIYPPAAFSGKKLRVPITLETPRQQQLNELIKALCNVHFPKALQANGLPLEVEVVLQPLTFSLVSQYVSDDNWRAVQSAIVQSATDAGRFQFDGKGQVRKTVSEPRHFSEENLPGFQALQQAGNFSDFRKALEALKDAPLFFPSGFLKQSEAVSAIYDPLRYAQLLATFPAPSPKTSPVIWPDGDQLMIKADPSFHLESTPLFIVNAAGDRFPLSLSRQGSHFQIRYGKEGETHSVSGLLKEMKTAFRIETDKGAELCTVYLLMHGQNISHALFDRHKKPLPSEYVERYMERHISGNLSNIENEVRQAVRDLGVDFTNSFGLDMKAFEPLLGVLRGMGTEERTRAYDDLVSLGGSNREHFLPAADSGQPGKLSSCAPASEILEKTISILKRKKVPVDKELFFNAIVDEIRKRDAERIRAAIEAAIRGR